MLLMANPAREVDRACRACRCQAAQASSCKIRSTVPGQRRGDKYGQSWLSSFRLTVTAPRIRAWRGHARGKRDGHARDVVEDASGRRGRAAQGVDQDVHAAEPIEHRAGELLDALNGAEIGLNE